ncbi:MAG: hydrogenase maturation nickel metallochaperone HypA [Nitrososphaerota archaeon]|nr:hydrogenase maturation nickel metallochaperone HypA [Nitrososphaerota archaeon]
MHEYVYADKILQSVLQEIGPKGRPTAVTVEIGEMLGLTRETLTSAYGILSKGTQAEGSKLKVKFSKGAVECPECGFHGRMRLTRHMHAVDPTFACPECGSSLRVSAGLEARLIAIE